MSKTFCCLPWTHLATHPHGGVTLCCVSDHTEAKNRARNFTDSSPHYLDLNNDSVSAVMNSDYYKQVRLEMLAGKVPEACRRCFKEEAGGVRSKRIEENERLKYTEETARSLTLDDGTIPVSFKFVELRLGNLCNVKCRTCNPASSTQWTMEYQKLQQELKFVTFYEKKMNTSWTESDEFWDDLLEHSGELELLYVNGGEPTLVEKHWRYLEKLIERGLNKQITLWYNINMTNLPDKLLDLWSQFKDVQVTCSIDDLGERNEYIRTGTKWADVIANLDKLQSLPWVKPSVCQTVGWMNALYLNEFHEFMRERGLHVHMNYVYDPIFLALRAIPTEWHEAVMSNSNKLDEWKLNSLRGQLSTTSDVTLLSQGLEYNQRLDQNRKTNYLDVFPKANGLFDTITGK